MTDNNAHVLDVFMNPESVAVFGSMLEGWFFGGGVVVKELLEFGYTGPIYPVHPTAEQVYGLKVYSDVLEIE